MFVQIKSIDEDVGVTRVVGIGNLEMLWLLKLSFNNWSALSTFKHLCPPEENLGGSLLSCPRLLLILGLMLLQAILQKSYRH